MRLPFADPPVAVVERGPHPGIIDRFLPPGAMLQAPAELRRARLVVGTSLFLAGISGLFAGIEGWQQGSLLLFALQAVTAVLMLANLLVVRWSRSAEIGGAVITLWSLAAVSLTATLNIPGYAHQYFAVVPLLSSFLAGPRMVLACTVAVVLELCLLDGLLLGRLPLGTTWARVGSIVMSVLVGGMALLAEGIRKRAERERDQTQVRLLEIMREQQLRAAELARANAELKRSNEELERFAYIASHDLQEPLRMVASYTQLLARRYRGKLDADADEFIDHAVGGAKRMQQLIQDLLLYGRAGTPRPLHPVDAGQVVAWVLADFKASIAEHRAEISSDPLPVVAADATQLGQLFQNLIGNALKFQAPGRAPRIHISARQQQEKAWVFSIRDNGIGIEPQYFERIFALFQRLHTSGEYQGTGLGLAICKKIVEQHGGRIWVESTPGEGTIFFFTLRSPAASGGEAT